MGEQGRGNVTELPSGAPARPSSCDHLVHPRLRVRLGRAAAARQAGENRIARAVIPGTLRGHEETPRLKLTRQEIVLLGVVALALVAGAFVKRYRAVHPSPPAVPKPVF